MSESAHTPPASEHSADGPRRIEILQTANAVIATSGMRASLQQIADSAGILAGSLYHHFESKEAILIELIRRYHADLDRIGAIAMEDAAEDDERPFWDRIVGLSRAIARCAVEHRAALQMSFFEGPSTDPELKELTQQRPVTLTSAMLQTLRSARSNGYLRAGVDLPVLADRMCQSMLRVGLDTVRHKASSDAVATLLCGILLHGLTGKRRTDRSFDKSPAFAAAQKVIATWTDEDYDSSDRAAYLRAVARAEFGRRGYEMTTVRDIASASGLGTGTVYRAIGSKDELLMSIMLSFRHKVGAGWTAALGSDSTPVEKLDALSWININALDRFPDEFRIQLAWMRQSPPQIADPGWSWDTRLRQMKALLSEGIRSGEIHIDSPSAEMLARCVISEQWIPENIVRELGTRESLIHSRDTILRDITTGA